MRFFCILLTFFLLTAALGCRSDRVPATPLETLKTYAKATKQKDTTTMKLLLSSESIKMHEQEAKARNQTIDDVVKDQRLIREEQRTLEFRNEKIEGDVATLEVKGSGGWEVVPFVREDGEWKIDAKGFADRFVEGVEQDQHRFDQEYNKGRVP